ncbi:MFS transporter [Nonomuraea terrae]|uniref:MFS transporter n=1 Tax=Nonomuraea terrae TaxID=2530383 RepID=UPI0014048F3F|nr:MFS transporter [Nonomuraea terrae]
MTTAASSAAQALALPGVPVRERARLLAVRAHALVMSGSVDAADRAADAAVASGEAFAQVVGLQARSVTAHVQQVLGWPAALFGLTTAVMTVASVAGAVAGQRVVTRLGVRPVAAFSTLLLGVACLMLTRLSADGSVLLLLIALVVFGTGMGIAAVCAQIAALSGVAERDSGVAAGLSDTSFAIGTALGVAICSTVTISGGAIDGPTAPGLASAYHTAFTAAALFAAAGLLIALTLLGNRAGRAHSPGHHPDSPDSAGSLDDQPARAVPSRSMR